MSPRKLLRTSETRHHREVFELFYGYGKKRRMTRLVQETGHSRPTLTRWRHAFEWDQRIAELDAEKKAQREAEKAADVGSASASVANRVKVAATFLKHLALLKPPVTEEGRLERQKLECLRNYWESGGNLTDAAHRTGISTSLFRKWRLEDEYFAECLEMVDEARHDYVESRLMEQIASGNLGAITFYLRNRRPELWNEQRFAKPQIINNLLSASNVNTTPEAEMTPDDQRRTIFDLVDVLAEVPGLRERLLGHITRAGDGDDGGDDSSAAVVSVQDPPESEAAAVSAPG